jgi:hypothetical protein
MKRDRTQQFSTMALALATLLFAGSAFAQADCSRVPEQYRARCEEAMRLKAACEGLEGEAKKHCEQRHLDYAAARENCGTLAGEARLACEQHNRAMNMATPCKGKAGAELEACIKTQASLRAR